MGKGGLPARTRPNGGEETIHHLLPPSPLTPPPTPIKIRHDFSPMPLAPVRSAPRRADARRASLSISRRVAEIIHKGFRVLNGVIFVCALLDWAP